MIKAAILAMLLLTLPGCNPQSHAKAHGFVYGRLKCAVNVSAYLKRIGRKSTGSASSASYRALPRTANPRRYDVVFVDRPGKGGHVMLYWGGGMCLNPRENRGWRQVPCNQVWRGRPRSYHRT
jgi:hypothetical protein